MKYVMKYIPGYETIYSATEDGKIFSHKSGKFRASRDDKDGYQRVNLSKNGKTTTHRVCRLIAKTYISNPNNYPQVNHKNMNKRDDSVKNLEWCTGSMNVKHSFDNGRIGTVGEINGMSKLTAPIVRKIRKLYSKGCTQQELADRFLISQTGISKIVNNKSWSHI